MVLLELLPDQIEQLKQSSEAHGLLAVNLGGDERRVHVEEFYVTSDGRLLGDSTDEPVTLPFVTTSGATRLIRLHASEVREGEGGDGIDALTKAERGRFARLLKVTFPGIDKDDEDMNGGDTVQDLAKLYARLTDEEDATPDMGGGQLRQLQER